MGEILEFGYTIRDVNKAVKLKLKQEDISVMMEGMDTRLPVIQSSPDEMLQFKKYPCIFINPGYEISTPDNWIIGPDYLEQVSSRDDTILETVKIEYTNVFYTYQIGFAVKYQSHCDDLVFKFMQMFPNDFYLGFQDAEDKKYKLLFKKEEELINLDDLTEENEKIYRRDLLITTRLVVTRQEYEAVIRPYNGVQIDMVDNNL